MKDKEIEIADPKDAFFTWLTYDGSDYLFRLGFFIGLIGAIVYISLYFHNYLSGFIAGILVVLLGFGLYVTNAELAEKYKEIKRELKRREAEILLEKLREQILQELHPEEVKKNESIHNMG